jgi:hypothetical protein
MLNSNAALDGLASGCSLSKSCTPLFGDVAPR